MTKLYDPSIAIKVIEVAKKYSENVETLERAPEYTIPGGPNSYHCSKLSTSWTQGFFVGLIWLMVERKRLLPESVGYTEEEMIALARRYQDSYEWMKRPAQNHDQGFRFQLAWGRDYELTGDQDAKEVMLEACESLVERYNPGAGCIRSWDQMIKADDRETYSRINRDKHFLVIIDNMMNVDMLFEATKLTGDLRFAKIATDQAEKSAQTHVREGWTTNHVVNIDQHTGEVIETMTHQGWSDTSCWSRGQAWGIYGFAQCALRTGRADLTRVSRKLADKFLSLLGPSGVPAWDFDAPAPAPYDASAGTIAARGMQMLYRLLIDTEPEAAREYLCRGNKLIEDTIEHCYCPEATVTNGIVDFGEGGWETILKHSTINGNPRATRNMMDHGLVYADYYLIEFANQALKLGLPVESK